MPPCGTPALMFAMFEKEEPNLTWNNYNLKTKFDRQILIAQSFLICLKTYISK